MPSLTPACSEQQSVPTEVTQHLLSTCWLRGTPGSHSVPTRPCEPAVTSPLSRRGSRSSGLTSLLSQRQAGPPTVSPWSRTQVLRVGTHRDTCARTCQLRGLCAASEQSPG